MKYLLLLLLLSGTIGFAEDAEEIFAGQETLFFLLKISGGFNGKLLLLDNPSTNHQYTMLLELRQTVPGENIRESLEAYNTLMPFGSLTKSSADSVHVIHAPNIWLQGLKRPKREALAKTLRENDILWVSAAGNIPQYGIITPWIYHSESSFWDCTGNSNDSKGTWGCDFESLKDFFKDGHAIMARYTKKRATPTLEEFIEKYKVSSFSEEEEEVLRKWYEEEYSSKKYYYIPYENNTHFDEMKEYGFCVVLPDDWEEDGRGGTSNASAHVAAFAFYLRQMWDTTEEVVKIMQKTAIDLGAPGVDEVFGWGLINANHPIIIERAEQKMLSSLSFSSERDTTLEKLTHTVNAKRCLNFFDISDGEIGFTYNKGKTNFLATFGSSQTPFGLNSRFLQKGKIAQIGMQQTLLKGFGFAGSYGHARNDNYRIENIRFGVSYQKAIPSGGLSVYAGHRNIHGIVGIPGYKMIADTPQTTFSKKILEVYTSIRWSF